MLYLVPTPIGNLRDITLRALDVLKTADVIACEDTRRTRQLLTHFEIGGQNGPRALLLSLHDHSHPKRREEILAELAAGKTVALVTDAGMPLISDPGFPLVREAIQKGFCVQALPGAFAGVTALAASGLPAESFSFFGFLPPKSQGRRKKLTFLATREETLVFYESPYRLLKVLQDMRDVLGEREAVVAREITKKFEEIVRGNISDLIAKFDKRKVLGEIVILVAGKNRKAVLA